jgi:hypothetical protein
MLHEEYRTFLVKTLQNYTEVECHDSSMDLKKHALRSCCKSQKELAA